MILREIFIVTIFLVLSVLNKNKTNEKFFSKEISTFVKSITAILILFGHCIQAINNDILGIFYVGWYGVSIFFTIIISCFINIFNSYIINFIFKQCNK